MSQQDYDNFKRKLRDWMESHPEEYNCFVGEMNVSSDEGYQQILNTAFSFIPKYKKVLTKKINEGDFETTAGICDDGRAAIRQKILFVHLFHG